MNTVETYSAAKSEVHALLRASENSTGRDKLGMEEAVGSGFQKCYHIEC